MLCLGNAVLRSEADRQCRERSLVGRERLSLMKQSGRIGSSMECVGVSAACTEASSTVEITYTTYR